MNSLQGTRVGVGSYHEVKIKNELSRGRLQVGKYVEKKEQT